MYTISAKFVQRRCAVQTLHEILKRERSVENSQRMTKTPRRIVRETKTPGSVRRVGTAKTPKSVKVERRPPKRTSFLSKAINMLRSLRLGHPRMDIGRARRPLLDSNENLLKDESTKVAASKPTPDTTRKRTPKSRQQTPKSCQRTPKTCRLSSANAMASYIRAAMHEHCLYYAALREENRPNVSSFYR